MGGWFSYTSENYESLKNYMTFDLHTNEIKSLKLVEIHKFKLILDYYSFGSNTKIAALIGEVMKE